MLMTSPMSVPKLQYSRMSWPVLMISGRRPAAKLLPESPILCASLMMLDDAPARVFNTAAAALCQMRKNRQCHAIPNEALLTMQPAAATSCTIQAKAISQSGAGERSNARQLQLLRAGKCHFRLELLERQSLTWQPGDKEPCALVGTVCKFTMRQAHDDIPDHKHALTA